MIKVDKVESNYSGNYRRNYQQKNGVKYTPSFTAKVPEPEFANFLKQKRLVKFLEKLKWFDGEQGRILITAIGTGAVAPLFIAWNPYVKPKEGATDEEKENLKKTKKYTAMRQPISAALAIPIQMSLVKPVERGLDVLFNNPKMAKFLPNYINKSLLQDDKYIETQEKKKLKNAGLSKKDFKTKLKENVENVKKEQVSQVANELAGSGQLRVSSAGDGFIDSKSTAEALKKEIRGYAGDANSLRYDWLTEEQLEELFNDPNKTVTAPKSEWKETYQKRGQILVSNEAELRKVLGSNLPKDEKEITQYLKNQLANTQDADLKKIYEEIIALGDGKAQVSRASRTLERIDKVKDACGGTFDKDKYLKFMEAEEEELLKRIRKFAEISKGLEDNPQSIKETIAKIAENCRYDGNDKKLKRIFNDISTFGENVGKLKEKICKDVVKGYKDMLKGRYRFFKEVAGISLGLFVTVPVTCHALNWVYPRFMDIFCPKLSGKKKLPQNKDGGDK